MSTVLHIQQLSDYLEQHPHTGDSVRRADILVPSGAVGCYSLDISDVPKRFLAQALPSMLEDHLADDIDSQHISHGAPKRNSDLNLLLVNHELMQQWLDSASSSGIDASGLYPDFYAVPYEEEHVSIFVNDDYAVVRTGEHEGFSGSIEEVTTLLSFIKDLSTVHYHSLKTLPSLEASAVFKPEITDFFIPSNAINLRSGAYSAKQKTTNPFKGFMVPLALAACLMLVLGINNLVQANYFAAQADLIEPKVAQDYRKLFGGEASNGWQAAASYQTRLAQVQLNSTQLNHWHLLKNLNKAIASCSSCQVDELTLNNSSALLTVKTEGSEQLLSSLQNSASLTIESKETLQNALSLKIKAVGA